MKLYLVLLITLLSGCTSVSRQAVDKPDLKAALNNNESIIHIKRADYFRASANQTQVWSDELFIGELANNDELVWKTSPTFRNCVILKDEVNLITYDILKLDDAPIPYKCFSMQAQEILELIFDFGIVERWVRPYSYSPVYKVKSDFDSEDRFTYAISSKINVPEEENQNLIKLLSKSLDESFSEKLMSESSNHIKIEILSFKSGNAAHRWLIRSEDSSTTLELKVSIYENNALSDSFITKLAIVGGGGFTVGGDEYIFSDAAEDIHIYLYGKPK